MQIHRFSLNPGSLMPLACALSIAAAFGALPAHAGGEVGTGNPDSCTKTAFNRALVGGGRVTFRCGPRPHTITLPQAKTIIFETSINGGGLITLKASNTNHFKVPAGKTLTLANISLTDGKAFRGGAIDNSGTTHVTGVTFANNTADEGGGAIANLGTLTVVRSTFTLNRAGRGEGGAIQNAGGTANVEGSKFDQNAATESVGGAIGNAATLTVVNSEFTDNLALVGGGALVNFLNATVRLSTFSGNESGSFGGAIRNDSGTLTVDGCTLSGNQAHTGGGIAHLGTMLTVIASTLEGNTATGGTMGRPADGGGGAIYAKGNASYTNSTFSGNQAILGGGGLYQDLGDAVLRFTTIANNFAPFGGGVHKEGAAGSLSLQNTLLSNNTDGNCSGRLISLGHNLSSDMRCGGAFGEPGDKNQVDARLGPLADNGGPPITLTHLPQPGSPAINGAVMVAGITTDQRGAARPRGPQPDIGSVEAQ